MASWTEKCVDRLKLLHEEGFSATVIAKKLGPDFTKGMVLGKLRRLALAEAPEAQETRKASVQRVIPPKGVPARRLGPPSSRIVLPNPHGPDPQATARKGVRLYDLHIGHCRWPVGDEKPARYFCGEQAVNGSSWCELHQRMAFQTLGSLPSAYEHRAERDLKTRRHSGWASGYVERLGRVCDAPWAPRLL